MFGQKIPSGADTVVQIRLTVSRGRPPVVWQEAQELSDGAVTAGVPTNQNVAATRGQCLVAASCKRMTSRSGPSGPYPSRRLNGAHHRP